jgi:hypothetical protein
MSLAGGTTAGKVSNRGPLDEESHEWLRCLAGTGRDSRSNAEREPALARLHDLLLRARAELGRRSRPVGVEGRERDDLAHQAADDALLAITSKLDRFGADPAQHAESRELVGARHRAVTEVLSDRQRARRRIRTHLVAHGYLDDEEPGMS